MPTTEAAVNRKIQELSRAILKLQVKKREIQSPKGYMVVSDTVKVRDLCSPGGGYFSKGTIHRTKRAAKRQMGKDKELKIIRWPPKGCKH